MAQTYPASLTQRLLWMAGHISAAKAAATPRQFLIRDLDRPALERALFSLRHRHEALRTRFEGRGPRLTQVVDEPTPVVVHDLPQFSGGGPGGNPGTGALDQRECFVASLRPVDGDHLLRLDIDHLLTDAWSYEVIRAEFTSLYDAYRQGRDAELPPVEWQYRDFADWQRERLAGPRLERLQNTWLDRIAEATPVALPDDRGRVDRMTRTAALYRLPEQEKTSEALTALASAGRTTIASAALAVYFLHLALITGQDDLSISSIFANRVKRQSWKTVGLFAHALPLRTRMSWHEPFGDLLRQTHQTTASALADQELPMSMLPTGALSRATMVGISNVVFQVLPTRAGTGESRSGQVSMLHGLSRKAGSRFDLEMVLAPDASRLRGFLRYASDRFPAGWIQEFAEAYCDLVLLAAADPARSPHELRALCGARMRALAAL